MGAEEHDGRKLEELARRMEALERENRELRETLAGDASEHRSEKPHQRPQATREKEATIASSKTVLGLLLGPREEQAYSRPLAGVLSAYAVGWLLTCSVAAYGAYVAFWVTVQPHSVGTIWLGLAPIAALLFGVYGGVRDGGEFAFGRFQYAALITALGTTVVVFLVSLGIAHWFWTPEEYKDIGFALAELITDDLNPFIMGSVFVSTWLLFVSGALLGTALQLWASEKERVGRGDSIRGGDGGSASPSSVRAQVWLGFAGTVLAALIGLIGTLIGGR